MTVTINDVNEAASVSLTPTIVDLDEDADTSSPIVVATINVTDDALGSETLSLTGSDAALFEISGSDLRLVAGASLDYETNPTLDVNVEIDDPTIPGDPDDSASFSLTINDVFESPTLVVNPIADTFLSKDNPSFNYGSSTSLVLDKSGGDIGDSRPLLRFDLSGIPVGATITNATLTMQAISGAGTFDIGVYEVTDSWLEGTQDGAAGFPSWDDRENLAPWNGGTYAATAIDTFNATGTGQHGWDITTLAQRWYDGSTTNNGLIIGSEDSGGDTYTYSSREGATPPELQIFYTVANAAPTDISPGSFAIFENIDTTGGMSLGALSATDADAGETFTWLIIGGADETKFSIGGSDELVLTDGVLDRESQDSYSVQVRVLDSANNVYDETITVSVNDLNDNSPVVGPGQSFDVSEFAADSTSIGFVAATDADVGTVFGNWTITSGNGAGIFTIDSSSGELSVLDRTNLDFETDDSHTLGITVSDGVNSSNTETVVINILDENDAPSVALTPVVSSLDEDADTSSAILVANIVVTDDALGSETLSLSGADAGLFEIVGSELRIAAGSALDFETNPSLDVTVNVDDTSIPGSPDGFDSYSITINDANEAPTVTATPVLTSLDEDADTSSAIVVATIVVSDDALGTESLSLSGTDAGLFEIVGNDLRLVAGATLDFETNPSLDVNVDVDDTGIPGSPDDSDALSVSINDVNEAPTLAIAPVVSTLPENTNTASGIRVADLSTTDDALGTNLYTLSGADAAFFELQAGNTELHLRAGVVLDFASNPVLDVTVSVDDAATPANPDDTVTHSITVTNVNNAPTVALTSVVTNLDEDADTSSGIKIADVSISDDAIGTNLLSLSGADAALFELRAGDTELYLRAGAVLDFETNPTLDVSVDVDDAAIPGSPDDSAVHSVSIGDVNEAPTISLVPVFTNLSEDTDTTLAIVVATIDVTDDALGTETFYLSGSDAALFEVVGTGLRVRAGASLDFETNPSLDVQVNADDASIPGSPESADHYSLVIDDANDAPTDIALDDRSVQGNTDAATVGKVAALDPDNVDSHTWTVDDARFEVVAGVLRLTAGQSIDPAAEPTVSLTVTATDQAGTGASVTRVFVIRVEDSRIPGLIPPSLPVETPTTEPDPPDENEDEEADEDGTPGEETPSAGATTPTNSATESGEELQVQIEAAVDFSRRNVSRPEPIDGPLRNSDAVASWNQRNATSSDSSRQAEGDSLSTQRMVIGFPDSIVSAWNDLRNELDNDEMVSTAVVGSSVAVTTGLSVGYVIWLIRGGVLVSSVLSSLPAWQSIDPLPVLNIADSARRDDEDEESLESIVKKSNQTSGAEK